MNSNSGALDGMFGGVTTISLSSATSIILTVPSTGTVSAAPGPNQSQNALIVFSGTLTGNCVIQFTLPGFYIVYNNCAVGTAAVQLSSPAGKSIGAPPGRKCHVFFDGTDMDYVDMPEVGSFMDMAVSTTPLWMSGYICTVLPWLICDGSVYAASVYPQLNNLLGSTFGGNGITSFGVPDLRARYRIPLDNQGIQGAANRITSAVAGISGTTIGAAGGDQHYQQHLHAITDPGHYHVIHAPLYPGGSGGPSASQGGTPNQYLTFNSDAATTSITVNLAGSGLSGNIPPGLVFGMTFIKT
jgi:hypothetical protein